MSENLDLVRSIFAAWERGDFTSADWAHPEIESVFPDGPSPGSWTGIAAMAEANRDFVNAWDGLRFTGSEYRELTDQRVLVLFDREGRGKRSGLELGKLNSEGAALFQVQDGAVSRITFYGQRDLALADLGLEE
jgi:ketosteroid isomerase-like protein